MCSHEKLILSHHELFRCSLESIRGSDVCFFLTALMFVSMMSDVSEGAEGEDEEPVEDLLKPGHLTRLLEEELAAEVEALCVGDVGSSLERLLSHLRTHRDSCQPPQLQVPATAWAHDTCNTALFSCR